MSSATFSMRPIGHVRSSRAIIEDDDWGEVVSTIALDASQFDADALLGLDAFSHIHVLFVFDQVDVDSLEDGARHPRGRTDWPRVGIFAQRAKRRPNRIGLSCARLVSVDLDSLTLTLEGLDALDGTPVLDIKPYVREFDVRHDAQQPEWMDELMTHYF